MSVRPAAAADVPMLARLHIAAWRETYAGLLPEHDIVRASQPTARQVQWARTLANPRIRTVVLDDLGFACIGPQRDPARVPAFPDELFSLYLLQIGQGRGHGKALLRAALGPSPQPLTATTLATNARACAFYSGLGGRWVDTVADRIGATDVTEHVYGWDTPQSLLGHPLP